MGRSVPIRVLIPAMVLVLGIGSSLVAYQISRQAALSFVLESRQARMRADLNRHQLDIEASSAAEMAYQQRVISGMMHYSDVAHALLLDANDVVVASTRLAEVGQALTVLRSAPPSGRLAQARTGNSPVVWVSEDNQQISGFIAVCRTVADGPLAQRDCGAMYISEDLRAELGMVNASLRRQLMYGVAIALLLVLAVLSVLYSSVIFRLNKITATARRVAGGAVEARVDVDGEDEISAIGRSINLMLDRVSATQIQLRDRQAHLSALFNDNAEGLIVIDRKGVVTDYNRRAEDIFGYRADEVVGHDLAMLMPAQHSERHRQMMGRYMATGEGKVIGKAPLHTEARHKDGRYVPVKIGVSEVVSGSAQAFIGTITDLTEIRILEEQAQRAQKMEAVGALTGGIAHDFNNLLGIIVGNLDLLRRRLADDPASIRRIEKALQAAGRGSSLTGKLLNFSRQRTERPEAVALPALLADIDELLDPSLTSRVELSISIEEDLPLLMVDPNSLEDALVNLVLNARDAMPDGGSVRIDARCCQLSGHIPGQLTHGIDRGEFVQISVSDTGTGIAPEILQRVFEPFFTTKPDDRGTGLGLAMVYAFVQRASGALGVDSVLGGGTVFRLYLPISEVGSQSANVGLEARASVDAKPGERVLVVEDEPELRELASMELQRLGYAVCEAPDADAALALLEADPDFQLVFSDVIMPGRVDGLALAKILAVRYPTIPVLLASGFLGQQGLDAAASEPLAAMILEKPYDFTDLALRVRELIDGHGLE